MFSCAEADSERTVSVFINLRLRLLAILCWLVYLWKMENVEENVDKSDEPEGNCNIQSMIDILLLLEFRLLYLIQR